LVVRLRENLLRLLAHRSSERPVFNGTRSEENRSHAAHVVSLLFLPGPINK
jgi:hypothetical protein